MDIIKFGNQALIDTLICSHVGYLQMREKIEGNNVINFLLQVNDTLEHLLKLSLSFDKKITMVKANEDEEEDGCFFTKVEIPSSYPGGDEAIRNCISEKVKSINYIEVNCIKMRLHISKNGTVSNIVIIKGIDAFLDNLVTKLGGEILWRPAIQNGHLTESFQDIAVCF